MELIGANPGRRIAVYFLLAIITGALVLQLPVSAARQPISAVDALFTATSAVCVTGLTVLDTGQDFSRFGQIVILILIQLGGIGIMTFATSLLMMVGARLSLGSRLGLSQTFSYDEGQRSASLLLAVIILVVAIESGGGLLLFLEFRGQFPAGEAAFQALFHSVSAFCNAGFSTFPDSLERFQGDYSTLAIFSALIVLGGLGFVVLTDLLGRLRDRKRRLSLHTKLSLSVSGLLIVAGAAAFFVNEYSGAFSGFGPIKSFANAVFQSITCRTAGFNAIAQRDLAEVSVLISMMLMFIGACPGSTGGGIKTTAFAAVMLTVYSRFRGRHSVSAFRRSLSADSILKAVTVMLLAVMVIAVITGLLLYSGDRPVAHRLSHGWFLDNLFEVVSAFGTVGLSLGMTAHLTGFGKVVIILCMFIGRVGLLTLGFALARRPVTGEIVYAEESVMIG